MKLTLATVLVATLGVQAQVQKPGIRLPASAAANKAKVKQMFVSAYTQYRKFAFGHDDLQPVSETFNDGRNGWGASIVDGMSTMVIMGLDDFFTEALNFSAHIDFSQSLVPSETVSLFETTIRYVGGLLSAFELSGSKPENRFMIDKAKEVADKMAFAWIGDNKVPFGEMNFTTNQPVLETSNIAEAGTLTLEWSTLSRLTGNDTYRQLTEGSVRQIAGLTDPLPGLAAQGIDPSTGQFVGGYVTWGGGSDSYFEYLIKYARLSLINDPLFVDTWRTAVDSSIKFLARTSTVGNHLYLADFDDDREILHIGSHLACFHGGNWLLGGKLLGNQTIVNFALGLVDACWNTYASTATGIGPETFAYISPDGNFTDSTPPTASQLTFNAQHGFYITGSDYILRPEVLESNFYAFRVTGDTKYLDRAASAIASFEKVLSINGAFSGIGDVNDGVAFGGRVDDTESFFFAEVLKYLYLTFDDPGHISIDDFVFNTEAHPFAAPPVKLPLATGTLKESAPASFTVRPGALPVVSPAKGLGVRLGGA